MSWPIVKLGDVFDISSSKRVHQKDWRNKGVPFYRAREVVALSRDGKVNNELFIDESMYEEYKSKFGVPKEGDLLVTAVGTLGQTYAVKSSDRFYFKDASVIWLSKKANVDTSYIQHALASPSVQRFIQNSSGATVGTYTISKAKETEIPLPPLAEQKRIAAILDKADALRRKRQQAIDLADQFLRSVFLDMFGDPVTNPKGWDVKLLKEISRVITGNTPPRQDPENYGSSIEWIKSDNINTPHHYLTEANEYLSDEGLKKGRSVPSGSVLITCIAGSLHCIGNAAIADREVAFNQQINALIPEQEVTTEYLYSLALFGKKLIQDASTNSMKGMVSKGNLEKLYVPVPPKALQKKYSEVFKEFLYKRKRQISSLEQSESLFLSLSQQAFRGLL